MNTIFNTILPNPLSEIIDVDQCIKPHLYKLPTGEWAIENKRDFLAFDSVQECCKEWKQLSRHERQ